MCQKNENFLWKLIDLPLMKAFEKLDEWLQSSGNEAVLVTKAENIGYLTDFWGSFGLYLQTKSGDRVLLTDGRYHTLATKLAKQEGFRFSLFAGGKPEDLVSLVKTNLVVEETLTIAEFIKYKAWFEPVELTPNSGVIENLRRIKTVEELSIMRTAQTHVDMVLMPFLKEHVRADVSERELKFKLDQALQAEGRYGLSFESIVAFGEGSALPHYVSGERTLHFGDNILIDCGVIDRHYCSDMTRNFVFGVPEDLYLEDYAVLLQKQKEVLESVKTGVEVKALDLRCREGLGERADLFVHALGHGLGLEVHEAPGLSKRSKAVLQTNEVVTIEPGLYRPEQYGIRIEDAVIVQPDEAEVITKTTKDLLSFDEAGQVQTLIKAT